MNIFLYDEASLDKSALPVLKKNYNCIPLTADPATFWGGIKMLGSGDNLILVSHGDQDGPLIVKGNSGKDMTASERNTLIHSLSNLNATFYCLSCHTADSDLSKELLQNGVLFIAPRGFAKLSASSAVVSVTSVEGTKYPGWVGHQTLLPSRDSRAVTIGYGK